MKRFKKTNYLHTPLFCEENIWHMTNSLIKEGINEKEIKIIFLTNTKKQICIFNQLAANYDKPIIWDYHVILLAKIESHMYIFDFDSRLDFPCDAHHYFKHSLPDNIHEQYSSQFRLISASTYLNHFYSDRSHMIDLIDRSLFPDYPAILSDKKIKLHLSDLLNFDKEFRQTIFFKNKNQLIDWVEAQ